MRLIAFLLISFFVATDIAHAGGLIMRIQMMKQMKNRNAQQEYSQEYQQYNQENQEQNEATSAAPAPLTYDQLVDQRNQMLATAIVNAHNLAVSTDNLPPVSPEATAAASSGSSGETVDLVEVWKKLDTKSTVWQILGDDQAKVLTVSEYIDRFRQEGVKINVPPAQYVQMIDQLSQQNPDMLNRPFGELLQILAIMNYDFDNGMDKDFLAKKVLGEEAYEANKNRFTQNSAPQPPQGQ